MPLEKRPSRSATIARLADRLRRVDRPRLAISAILTVSALLGFLASVVMLSLGLVSMPLRYGLAMLLAYGGFLAGVRIWLSRKLLRSSRGEAQWLDALDPSLLSPGDAPTPAIQFAFGGSGGSSGGGGGAIEFGPDPGSEVAASSAEALAGAADLDEGMWFLLPIILGVAILAGVVSAVLLVSAAPVLLGEVLLDGMIAGTAYRRLQHLKPQHWAHGAIRRTWRSALAVLAALVGAGWLVQWLIPSARSLGDVVGR